MDVSLKSMLVQLWKAVWHVSAVKVVTEFYPYRICDWEACSKLYEVVFDLAKEPNLTLWIRKYRGKMNEWYIFPCSFGGGRTKETTPYAGYPLRHACASFRVHLKSHVKGAFLLSCRWIDWFTNGFLLFPFCSCVKVEEHQAADIDLYHCPNCEVLHGPSLCKYIWPFLYMWVCLP